MPTPERAKSMNGERLPGPEDFRAMLRGEIDSQEYVRRLEARASVRRLGSPPATVAMTYVRGGNVRLALRLLACAWYGHDDAVVTAKPHRCRRCGLMIRWVDGRQRVA